jgi:hypothetical protein
MPQECGCINVLGFEEGKWEVNAIGCLPEEAPGPQQCNRLWEEYHTPAVVRLHCIAVRDHAIRMAERLRSQGTSVNFAILEAAALLHDLCRTEKDHEKKAAEVLRKHGWLRLASIVLQHHDRAPDAGFNETDILYLADKYIKGTVCVSLQQRFEESLKKCKNPEAKLAHEMRYRQAIEIENKFLQLAKTKQ